ncbi:MAG: sugar porter family MFS transporter [Saprospiraceae bacterium]|nr:sugar porter family MFS transporter [Bacteroidia bacterium]NNE14903.1 sugar porter family MFS transporter [Saprospiraceae bacterium]NNL91844.1 sugar porter family MFS transporter [Saprospiraceae bacterium]
MQTKKYILFLATIVSIGGFLFGFDAAVISGCNSFITAEFNLTSLELGTVVASVTISSALAMLFAGGVSDAIGRKKVLIFVALLYSISAIFSALAPSYLTLIIARLIGGIAFGSALVLVPVYIAEIVPAKMRGSMVSIQQLAIVLGFSVAYFSNYYFLNLSKSGSEFALNNNLAEDVWRWMLGVEAIPALVYFILLFFIPNSPRWLIMKGKDEEASDIITKINGAEKTNGIVSAVKESIAESLNSEKLNFRDSLKSLFKPKYKKILAIAFIIAIAQMSVGINAVFFYATNIFELTGIGTDASFVQSVWVGIINVIFTLIAVFLIDRVGRRPLLLTGIAGITFSLLLVAYGFKSATYSLDQSKVDALNIVIDKTKLTPLIGQSFDNDVLFGQALHEVLGRSDVTLHKGELVKAAGNLNAVLLLIGILCFVAFFAFSLGPVMWVLLSEIFPNSIRGIAISTVGFTNSLTSYFVVQFFPWQLETFGSAATFLIYALFAMIAFFLLFKLLPETKGKSLEELEKELAS